MSDDMRDIVRALAQRCSVCVVSGRDRAVVSELMGVDDLIVAGSHGFDIYDPARGPIVHEASQGWEGLVAEVTERVRAAADDIPGTLVEPKHASVALHDRHVADADRPRVAALVEAVLAEHPGELRVTPGKFVHEIQPKIDWNKGKAVEHLLDVLDLDHPDVVPIYLGDDVTDEDAFRALVARADAGRPAGIGILVIDPEDAPSRETSATAVLATVDEVGRFLDGLADEPDEPDERDDPADHPAARSRSTETIVTTTDQTPSTTETTGSARTTPTGEVLPGGAVADDFTITWTGVEPDDEGLREALTSTGNGYFCTRGAAEWEDTEAPVHYAGTYAHGGFNRETTILGGRPVLNEDLVNLPNWLVLKLRIEGEEAIDLSNVEVLEYTHTYDVRTATVGRVFRFRDRNGRETTLRSRRFVSMAHSHQAAMEWTLTAENWSGRIGIVSAIDGRVDNTMVARYRDLEGRHLDPVTPRTFGPEVIALKVRTRQSNLYVSEAARTRIYRGARARLGEGRPGPHAAPDERLHPAGARPRHHRGRDRAGGEDRLVLHQPRQRDHRDPHRRRPARRALPGLRGLLRRARRRLGGVLGRLRHRAAARADHPAAPALPHGPRAAGLLAAHRPPRRRRPRPRAQRRGLPRARVLGRALRLPVPQLPAPGDHPRAADVPLPAPRRGPGGRARRDRLPPARCSRGSRAATAPRRPRSSTSTRSRAPGTRTTRTTSATSTPRSSTTSGSTTRPPTTWSSCATTAPS